MAGFDSIPQHATLKPTRFRASIPDSELREFEQLLRLSKIGPQTYENLQEDRRFGLTHEWITQAKQVWETSYDWRACEAKTNSFPNFTVSIQDDDGEIFTIHFVALFSAKKDAVPLTFLHGWPGSFLEFLDLLNSLRQKYPSPTDLPYHVVVPSLLGYGYSSGPPITKDWALADMARIMNKLMVGLGFESGYIAQGGDIGSYCARLMAVRFDACKAIHLNFAAMPEPKGVAPNAITHQEKKALLRAQDFSTTGNAYAREHGTRPATIGLVLSSSPVALLAWIAEKFQQWTDADPPLTAILDSVTLYWFTSSFPRSIYPYRQTNRDPSTSVSVHGDPKNYCRKPMGFSWFPMELAPMPRAWVETTGKLVWWRGHEDGGHFAGIEKPGVLLGDVEDFVGKVWEGDGGVKAGL